MATILICEDEAPLRELMRAILDGDYRFAEAADGRAALALARELEPDLVVLDLMLPGENGLDVLRELRSAEVTGDVPVVVVTAWTGEEHRRAAFEAGADRFLPKPFEPDDLTAAVEELLAVA